MLARTTALVALLLSACPAAQLGLVVELRTDFVPGVEFVAVRTTAYASHPSAGADPVREAREPALRGQDFLGGGRVAELDVEKGRLYVEVELMAADGTVIAQRIASVETTTTRALILVVSRSCRGVACADGEACVSGLCVPCEDGACNDGCSSDSQCDTPLSDCAEARCIEGSCYVATLSGACATDQWCNPDIGCMALPEMPDGGAVDGGGVDAGPCTPSCSGLSCGPDPVCGTSCGGCGAGESCVSGHCMGGCTPDCSGLACGPDRNCGSSCGSCSAPATCQSGSCVCTPDCSGRECGADPVCGQDCGGCGAGSSCTGTTCCDVLHEACSGTTCCGGMVCTGGSCCVPVGMGCGDPSECCPGRTCTLGRCCVIVGDGCSSEAQCCNSELGTRACMGGHCCVRLGGGCSSGPQCCSGSCSAGACI